MRAVVESKYTKKEKLDVLYKAKSDFDSHFKAISAFRVRADEYSYELSLEAVFYLRKEEFIWRNLGVDKGRKVGAEEESEYLKFVEVRKK